VYQVCALEGLGGYRLTDDNGWRARREVQDSADGVVHGCRGIEPPSRSVGKPRPQPFQKAWHAVERVPFPGRIEVDAQAVALQDVGVAGEPCVFHLDLRRGER
jgi:hypothetical protein